MLPGSTKIEIEHKFQRGETRSQLYRVSIESLYTRIVNDSDDIYVRCYDPLSQNVYLNKLVKVTQLKTPICGVTLNLEGEDTVLLTQKSTIFVEGISCKVADLFPLQLGKHTLHKTDVALDAHTNAVPRDLRYKINGIPGYDMYSVSNTGTVFLKTQKGQFIKKTAKRESRRGGFLIDIHNWQAPYNRTAYVHDLVLEAFVGRDEMISHGYHLNGDQRDNRLSNLRWMTIDHLNSTKPQQPNLTHSKLRVLSYEYTTQLDAFSVELEDKNNIVFSQGLMII